MPTVDCTIDVRLSRLRQQLGGGPRHPRIIRTEYASGYLLAADMPKATGH